MAFGDDLSLCGSGAFLEPTKRQGGGRRSAPCCDLEGKNSISSVPMPSSTYGTTRLHSPKLSRAPIPIVMIIEAPVLTPFLSNSGILQWSKIEFIDFDFLIPAVADPPTTSCIGAEIRPSSHPFGIFVTTRLHSPNLSRAPFPIVMIIAAPVLTLFLSNSGILQWSN
eukprot:CAMPEP_0172176494 /NCGR_PEP_ID=MMETSP1050-20130122/14840_1 /TAXON_ID=233186 /ORGANISM="Cryptomonas curvata, Strain CCAP979/52" /LENGTH=166 /DNA_ID=CAMNT_0012848765 /DNA_START=317 /DNA_END=814 /DNA_ORIENTATION=-